MTAFAIYPATFDDGLDLAEDLRPADAQEIAHLSGLDPASAIRWSIDRSEEAWAVRGETGRLICVYGVSTISVLGAVGAPWFLGTPGVTRHTRAFLAGSPVVVARWLEEYEELRNVVWEGNYRSIRYLKALGFKLGPRQVSRTGAGYHMFRLTREEAAHV